MFYGRLTDLTMRCKNLPNLDAAFAYLTRLEDPAADEHRKLTSLNVGEVQRVEIQGKKVFAILQCYMSKARPEVRFEAHRKYIDVQYVLTGTEIMALDITPGLKPVDPYNAEKDVVFLMSASPMDIPLGPGTAAVLFPEDAHAPGITGTSPEKIYKCVMKVELE